MVNLPTDYQDVTPPTGALTELPAAGPRGLNAINARSNFLAAARMDVKEFLAAGNGVTDDTAAIAAAIAAASGSGGSGIVYFRPGVYITSPIALPAGTALVGAEGGGYIDWAGTVPSVNTVSQLKLKAGSTGPLISPASSSSLYSSVKNLSLNCNGINQPAINLPDGSGLQRNWMIEDCHVFNVNTANAASGYAVYVGQGNSAVEMHHCTIFNGVSGLNTTVGYNGLGWYGPDGQMFDVWIGGFRNTGFTGLGGANDYTFQWVGGGTFWNTTGAVVGGGGWTFVGVSFDHNANDGVYNGSFSSTFVNCAFHTNSMQTTNTWSHINVAGTGATVSLIGCRTELKDAGVTSSNPAYFVNNSGGATNTVNIVGCYDNSGGQFGTGWSNASPQIKHVAGAVSDGSFTLAPPNGTFGLDTSNNRLYVRINGTWRYAALT